MQIASRVQGLVARPVAWLSSLDTWSACSLVLLLIVSTFVISTFRDYGISWDEEVQNTYGEHILSYYRSDFTDLAAVSPNEETDDGNLPYYGGGFDLPAVLLQRISPVGPYETRHLLGGLVGIAGLAVTWRLGRRLAGPRAGFLALALTATIPAYYGHMFINPKDLPFAAAMVALLLVVCRILEEWPEPRWRSVALLGIAGGIAIGTRVGAVAAAADFLVPLGVWALVVARREGLRRALVPAVRGCLRLLAALPIAYALMALLWPWSVREPLNPLVAYQMFSRFPFDEKMLLMGQIVAANDLPRDYLPLMMAVTLPEILLAGLLLAVLLGLRWVWVGAPGASRARTLQTLAVATAGLLPVVYFLLERPTAYNGLRHFLFILPPLAVLAATALDRLLNAVRVPHRAWVHAVILVAMLLPVARMLGLHPFEYIDFNDFLGGLQAADGKFELDYWGVSLAETTRSLAAMLAVRGEGNPTEPWRVWVDAEPLSAGYFMPPSMRVAKETDTPDFWIALCPCEAPPGAVEVTRTTREGVTLSIAYDVRARAVAREP